MPTFMPATDTDQSTLIGSAVRFDSHLGKGLTGIVIDVRDGATTPVIIEAYIPNLEEKRRFAKRRGEITIIGEEGHGQRKDAPHGDDTGQRVPHMR